jgi:hypothetical protein
MLPGSLICPVLIAPSVFFNICLFTKHHAKFHRSIRLN